MSFTRLHYLVLACYLGACPLFAQVPILNANNKKTDDQNAEVEVKFTNSPIGDIVTVYENYTGKRMIRDATLGANAATLTIVSSKSLPKAEAIRFIEAALLLNGFTIQPGPDNSLKIINSGSGKNPRSEGVPLLANVNDLPPGDQLISFYLPLKFISSSQALPVFTAQAPPHPYGAYFEVPHTQAVVLTENTSVIRQLLALKELIDVPPVQVVREFVKLRRADAEKVASTLIALLDASKKGQGITPALASSGGALQPPGAVGQLESQLVAGETQIVPDARTNRILLVSRPVNLPFLKDLIEQFDQATVIEPLQRPLKYITATEVLPIIKDLLTDTKDDATTAASGTTPANTQRGNTPQNRPAGSSGPSGSGAGQLTASSLLGDAPDLAPSSIIVGRTKVIADAKSNTILVVGPPESIDKVRSLLDQMDRKPRQVYLATVVGKLTLNKNSELSVDLLQNFAHYTGDAGVATSALHSSIPGGRLDPTTLSSAGVFPALSGTTVYGAVGSTLNYYVKALLSTGRFTVLARPSVFAANNKKATISSGQLVPVPTTTLTQLGSTGNNTGSGVQANIDYKAVVLQLEVIPLINSNNEVNLQVAQQNQSIVGNTTLSGNTIPILASDTLQTTVTIPNHSTLALGGLIRDSDSASRVGVPWLSNIPLLGALFRGDTISKQRDELVILIEPQVIETDEELAAIQKTENARSQIADPSVEFSKKTPPSKIGSKGTVPTYP